jgi:hypothetical protein
MAADTSERLVVCAAGPMCVLQEALRLREAKAVDEVIAVSLGPQQVQVRYCIHTGNRSLVLASRCMPAPRHAWPRLRL